jgi:hypothetical protein
MDTSLAELPPGIPAGDRIAKVCGGDLDEIPLLCFFSSS